MQIPAPSSTTSLTPALRTILHEPLAHPPLVLAGLRMGWPSRSSRKCCSMMVM